MPSKDPSSRPRPGPAVAPPDLNRSTPAGPDTEVDASPARRRFTAEFKLAFVRVFGVSRPVAVQVPSYPATVRWPNDLEYRRIEVTDPVVRRKSTPNLRLCITSASRCDLGSDRP